MEFWTKLFDTSDFPARWTCGRWTDAHGWLHIGSDLGVWSAYFAIPCILGYFILRRKDLPFRLVFLLFGAFILLCGTTHLMDAALFWWPAYRLSGLIKFATAVVSWTTVFALIQIVPRALLMRTPEELEREIAARKEAEEALRQTNLLLEQRVQERTADLAAANAALAAEREWFKTTLASIGDGVAVTDVEGRVATLNRVAERLTGWKQGEAVGKPLSEVFRIEDEVERKPVENPALRALATGETVGMASRPAPAAVVLIAKDGVERFIDESAAPIRGEQGETIGAVLIFRDVSERQRADQERRELSARLTALVQNAPIGIALLDADLRFVDLNERAAAGNGRPKKDHFGKTVSEVLPEMGSRVESLLRQVRDTGEPLIEIEVAGETPARPGETRHWIVSYYPVRDDAGTVLGIGAVGMEITDRKRAEQALRYQYDLTKAITDNARTAIFMMDAAGRCTFMNPAAETMTGFTSVEADGRLLHDLIHHSRPDGTPYPISESPIDRALPEKAEVHDREDVFIRKSGEFFPVTCNARPIVADGRSVGTVVEALDLTSQKLAAEKLRESEVRFQQLADAMPTLAWMAQPDGNVEWYNSRWYEYTGKTFEEMSGWGWRSVHDPARVQLVEQRWRASLVNGAPFDMVFPLRGADGVFRPFLTRATPFHDEQGKLIRWFGTSTDVSEQEKVQEELRQIAAKLSEADRRKDEFLATLAHELRNPLAPIRTGLEVMKLARNDSAALEEIRAVMERQTQLLVALVDDLLDVSRITRGKLELRKCRVNLSDLVRNAVETSKPFIDEAGHQFHISLPERPIHLNADPHRLAQVLSNLLNNAVKYTPAGGRVALSAERDKDVVVVTVEDSGVGIPSDMLGRVFEMFAQIERPIEKGYTGLGIGLTLVKSLVEMHGGSVEVSSPGLEQGSTFKVRLPVLVDPPMEQSSPLPLPGHGGVERPRKVLVVDDNRAAADMLSMVVKLLGNEVRVAGDGQEAVDVAAEFLPDVVLMDLGMPRMNGYEAARFIRQQPWGGDMLIVALTGWGQEEDRQRTKEAGFDHHLVKPADPADLQRLFASSEGRRRDS